MSLHEINVNGARASMNEQFRQLAMSLADGADEPLVQQRLVEFAVRGVPGAEHASLTLVAEGRPPRTPASSDEAPYQWDQLQYQTGEGPCLEVSATRGFALVEDFTTDTRWPRFAEALLSQTPARSMLSFGLFHTKGDRAALNLYSTKAGAFTDKSAATGSMFAAYSSMALLAAAAHNEANHLKHALETNREIGVAIGILMANGKLTRQVAFDQLRRASNVLNRKLKEIAADVAQTGRLPESRNLKQLLRRTDGSTGA